MPEDTKRWQNIAWDGVSMDLPGGWQPTGIDKACLFFERAGEPAFAIKWNKIRGRFSAARILKRLQDSLPRSAVVEPWKIPDEISDIVPGYSVTGFTYRDREDTCLVVLLFCARCRRATILQQYAAGHGHSRDLQDLQRILQSFTDHPHGQEQAWSMYDISARLPARAELKSHEFLAGRYTLSFALHKTRIDLYRFKPAAVLLKNRSLREFGAPLAENAACVHSVPGKTAVWEYTAAGFDLPAVMLGRKPGWIWLSLQVVADKNAILAVKGTGRRALDRELMEHIAENFSVGTAA